VAPDLGAARALRLQARVGLADEVRVLSGTGGLRGAGDAAGVEDHVAAGHEVVGREVEQRLQLRDVQPLLGSVGLEPGLDPVREAVREYRERLDRHMVLGAQVPAVAHRVEHAAQRDLRVVRIDHHGASRAGHAAHDAHRVVVACPLNRLALELPRLWPSRSGGR
jgi:hypothetical protein